MSGYEGIISDIYESVLIFEKPFLISS